MAPPLDEPTPLADPSVAQSRICADAISGSAGLRRPRGRGRRRSSGRVGMKRLAPLPGQVSSSPAPNRTCEFPRIRLSMRGLNHGCPLTMMRGRGLPPRTCRLPFGRARPGWRSIRSVCEDPGPGIAGVWRQQIGRVSSRPSASRCAPQSSARHRCGAASLRAPCCVSCRARIKAPPQPPVVLGELLPGTRRVPVVVAPSCDDGVEAVDKIGKGPTRWGLPHLGLDLIAKEL